MDVKRFGCLLKVSATMLMRSFRFGLPHQRQYGGLSIMKLSIKRAFAIDQALYAYFADRNRTVIKGGAAI